MRHLCILIVFLTLLMSGSVQAGSSYEDTQNLLLFYSNDVLGETEPCG